MDAATGRMRCRRRRMERNADGLEASEPAALLTNVDVEADYSRTSTRGDGDKHMRVSLAPESYLAFIKRSVVLAMLSERKLSAISLGEWQHWPSATRVPERRI
jgi:hypothetical protein